MINLQGTLINAFRVDGGKGKDGKEYEARDKVQILGSLELPNGEIKHELVDLTVEDSRLFEPFKIRLLASRVVLWLSVVMLFFMSVKAQNRFYQRVFDTVKKQ